MTSPPSDAVPFAACSPADRAVLELHMEHCDVVPRLVIVREGSLGEADHQPWAS